MAKAKVPMYCFLFRSGIHGLSWLRGTDRLILGVSLGWSLSSAQAAAPQALCVLMLGHIPHPLGPETLSPLRKPGFLGDPISGLLL